MTSATVATKQAAAQSGQSQAKPEKIRKDHSINWWLTAAVAEDAGRSGHVQPADHVGMA